MIRGVEVANLRRKWGTTEDDGRTVRRSEGHRTTSGRAMAQVATRPRTRGRRQPDPSLLSQINIVDRPTVARAAARSARYRALPRELNLRPRVHEPAIVPERRRRRPRERAEVVVELLRRAAQA